MEYTTRGILKLIVKAYRLASEELGGKWISALRVWKKLKELGFEIDFTEFIKLMQRLSERYPAIHFTVHPMATKPEKIKLYSWMYIEEWFNP